MIFEYEKDIEQISERLNNRKELFDRNLLKDVNSIFDEVENLGDKAVLQNTQKWDNVILSELLLESEFVKECIGKLDQSLIDAIRASCNNIREVNELLMPELYWEKQVRAGTVVGEKITPLKSVGLYVPARKGPLVSTSLMLITAAKVAGVNEIIVAMPPTRSGEPDYVTVAAAKIAGASKIVVGNGVSLIAGLTIGTKSIPKVDGIFGPGPGAIAASMSVSASYGVKTILGIGPSDSMIVADENADAMAIAIDMLNEGEHGSDSSSVLVTTSSEIAQHVKSEIEKYLSSNTLRKEILEEVFGDKGMGIIIVCNSLNECCNFVNSFAPEHLMICVDKKDEFSVVSQIENAGEILIGKYSSFSAGNYAIGITAVLPTNYYAKVFSGITCKDMIKYSTIGKIDKSALQELLPIIKEFSECEGLPHHLKAVDYKLNS